MKSPKESNTQRAAVAHQRLVRPLFAEAIEEAIEKARQASHHADGKCSMCAVGDEPSNGLHRGQHRCGNEDSCMLCHNAGMEYGDQCAACGRIEKNHVAPGA